MSVNPVGVDEEGVGGGPVLVLADLDRIGRMWNAWAIVDEQGAILGAFTDCESVVIWEGADVAQARAIVATHCR